MISGGGPSLKIGIPWELAENGHWTVFGDQAYNPASGQLPPWMELPGFALSFHVAHELTPCAHEETRIPHDQQRATICPEFS